MAGTPSISVVLPAFNEEESLEKCVVALERELARLAGDFEIIVVDDGSTDGTADVLARLASARPYLVILRHERNRGLGQTLRTGFARCGKELVFYSDADLPFDFHELEKALRVREFKDADVVTGFRHDRTSEGFLRILYSFVYNLLVRVAFGLRVKDVNCSFKLLRNDVLRRLDLRSDGSFIDAEMMVRADRMGFAICQIGVDYFNRRHGRSHLTNLPTILKILREMARQYPALRRIRPAR